MAKPPTKYLDAMSQNSNGSLDGDLFASMAKLVEQTSKLGKQRSRPQPHDLAEMMRLCSQVMHVCSRILQETSPAADGTSATPTNRKKASTAKESGPNSDNERALFGTDPVPFAQSPDADPSYAGRPKLASKPPSYRSVLDFEDAAHPHTEDDADSPTPGDIGSIGMIDEQILEPLDFEDIPDGDLDIDLLDEFSFSDSEFFNEPTQPLPKIYSTTGVAADSCASAAQDQAGPGTSVKNDPPSGKNQSRDRKQGKGKKLRRASYLNKLVANTNPKVPLGEYLKQTDVKLVCVCGRGGHAHHHAGNKDYLDSIEARLQGYKSLSRKGKEEFTNSLVKKFKDQGRRFLRLNRDDEWEEMDQLSIRRKVSQNFRDGPTPSPKERKHHSPRRSKKQRSDALLEGEEASQPTPPAA